jgi:hypothetical protein
VKEFEKRVIDVMVFEGVIPQQTVFEITSQHLEHYISIYGSIFGRKNSTGFKREGEHRFARKLAGRTLVRLNTERGAKFNDIKAGMVYLISNPNFPDHYKVGMCLDINDRLATYQTYDPYRRFKVEKYNFVLDRRHCEERLLQHPDIFKEQGEWIKRKNAVDIFASIA